MLISMAGEGAVLVAEDGQVFEESCTKRQAGKWCGCRRFHGSRIRLQAGWRRRITNMHSTWELQQEVQAHFLKILQQRKK